MAPGWREVCVCVCVCVRIYVCICVFARSRVCVWMCVCVRAYLQRQVCGTCAEVCFQLAHIRSLLAHIRSLLAEVCSQLALFAFVALLCLCIRSLLDTCADLKCASNSRSLLLLQQASYLT